MFGLERLQLTVELVVCSLLVKEKKVWWWSYTYPQNQDLGWSWHRDANPVWTRFITDDIASVPQPMPVNAPLRCIG